MMGTPEQNVCRADALRECPLCGSWSTTILGTENEQMQAVRETSATLASIMGLQFTADEILAGEADDCSLARTISYFHARLRQAHEEYASLYSLYLQDCDDTEARDMTLGLAATLAEARADEIAHAAEPEWRDHRDFQAGREEEARYLAHALRRMMRNPN